MRAYERFITTTRINPTSLKGEKVPALSLNIVQFSFLGSVI